MAIRTKRAAPRAEPDHQTLGHNVIPSSYSLTFKPDSGSYTFEGREVIDVSIASPTNEITLNAAELSIKSAKVISNGVEQQAAVTEDPENERIVLKVGNKVGENAQISIEFTGINNDLMYGFYRSSYRDGADTKTMLTSQFESADARKAFPCFDEPEFKATFKVSFVVDKGLEPISNMPVASSSDIGNGLKKVTFEETPRMSTYLLYLGVGEFERVTDMLGNIEISVITTPGNKHMAELPLEMAKKFLSFYQNYFGIEYPLPKLDLIAVPDFAAGAMENWGAITFREVDLLADKNTSIQALQRVSMVIAHELAHQWFGNLVTMKWWNDLWLNESFADFMSYKAMDAVFPEWKMKREFIKDEIPMALAADQLKSTHPISVKVNSPEEIVQLFDEISYEKGGSVLNMIEDYAGADVFKEGLHRYLKHHAYSNATKFNLWKFMDDVARELGSDINVSKVACTWIDQPGYPAIEVKRVRDGIELRQRRHFLLSSESDSATWPVPIRYRLGGRDGIMLMESEVARMRAGRDEWLKLNYGQNGFYRAAYDGKDLDRLGDLIMAKRVEDIDSWGIERDLFAMAMSGRVKAGEYLDFVEKYCLGLGYPLNFGVLSGLGWMARSLPEGSNNRAREILIRHSSNVIDALGWNRKDGEATFDTVTRSAAILRLGLSGHKPTIARAVSMFYDYIDNGVEIESNIKNPVYYLAARAEGERIFETLKSRFREEKVAEEKIRMLQSMAMFDDSELLRKAFDFAVSADVKIQDTSKLVTFAAVNNPSAKDIILGWTEDNWSALKSRYSTGTHTLNKFIDCLNVLDTQEDLDEFVRFFSSSQNFREDLVQSYAKTKERIEANIQFRAANE
jgi:tricorn protease interacting factor F2/3